MGFDIHQTLCPLSCPLPLPGSAFPPGEWGTALASNGKQSRRNLACLLCTQQVFRKFKQLLGIYCQYDFNMAANTTPCRPLPENPLMGLSPVAGSGLIDHLVVILLYPLGFYNMPLEKNYFSGKMLEPPLTPSTAANDTDSTFLRRTLCRKHRARQPVCPGQRTERVVSEAKTSHCKRHKCGALHSQGAFIPCPTRVGG